MPDSQENLNGVFSLAIDVIRLGITLPIDEVTVKNVYVDVDDTHIRVVPFEFSADIDAAGLIVNLPPTTLGSIYEIQLLSRGKVVLSAYFDMPKNDCFLSDLPLYTAFPPRESYPVDTVSWGDIKGSLTDQTDLSDLIFTKTEANQFKQEVIDITGNQDTAINEGFAEISESLGGQVNELAQSTNTKTTQLEQKINTDITGVNSQITTLDEKVGINKTQLEAKDAELQGQINSIGGGKFAYIEYADMVAAAALPAEDPDKLPAKSSIDIINDPDGSKNGTYAYDGNVFTKSPYDPLTLSKGYTDTSKAEILSKVHNTFGTKAELLSSPLPNGSTAIVYDDPTLTHNISYKKVDGIWVDLKTKTLIKRFVNGFLSARQSDINVDTTAHTISISIGRIVRNAESYLLNNAVVSYDPNSTFIELLIYNPDDDSVVIERGSNLTLIADSAVVFGSFYIQDGKPVLNGVSGYYVNGAPTTQISDSSVINSDTTQAFFKTGDVNFDMTNRDMHITGDLWIPLKDKRVIIKPQDISFTSSTLYQAIILNTDDSTISIRTGGSNFSLAPEEVLLGALHDKDKTVFGFDAAYINGLPQNGAVSSSKESAPPLIVFRDGNVRFNFAKSKIEFLEALWIPTANGRINISARTINLDPNRNIFTSTRTVVLYNKSNGQIVLADALSSFTIPDNHILLGAYHERYNEIWGFEGAWVNDKPIKKQGTLTYPWDTTTFDNLNVPDSFKFSGDPITMTDIDSTMLYSWYDALVTAHPEYVSKVNLGKDASGTLDIFEYIFKPATFNAENTGGVAEVPRVMIQTLHNERINMVYPYLMMREICENWSNNETLEGLRFGAEIRVIPCLNVWGLDNVSRTNSNGIDLNRNYPIGWTLITNDPDNNSGAAPLSEAETQIGYGEMLAFKPHVFVDLHSFGAHIDGRSIWLTSANNDDKIVVNNTAVKSYRSYKKRYPWMSDYNPFARVLTVPYAAGVAANTAAYLGMTGGLIEIAYSLQGDPDAEVPGNNVAINYGVDTLTYFVKQSIAQAIRKVI